MNSELSRQAIAYFTNGIVRDWFGSIHLIWFRDLSELSRQLFENVYSIMCLWNSVVRHQCCWTGMGLQWSARPLDRISSCIWKAEVAIDSMNPWNHVDRNCFRNGRYALKSLSWTPRWTKGQKKEDKLKMQANINWQKRRKHGGVLHLRLELSSPSPELAAVRNWLQSSP